ncbi:M23 family metallopeptidase [Nocardioides thalensis]|nr:M23 family metallopeptidase [Nocardioides thalensis]
MPHLPRLLAGPTLAGLALTGATLTPTLTASANDVPDPETDRITLVSANTGPLTGRIRIQRGQVIHPVQLVRPVEGYELTGRFGASSGLWSSSHTGLDFAVPQGTAIRAITDAVVVSTDYDGSYGLKTVLRTEDGTELWLCHQDSVTVAPGEHVTAGQEVGYVGMTGNTTGPHLHLEVRPGGGDPVDPEAALADWGIPV